MSLATGLVASGSTQAGALPIRARNNVFATVAASTGCRLPSDAAVGTEVMIRNSGANALTVYPPVGYQIEGTTTVSLGTSTTHRYVVDQAGNWWRVS